VGRAGWAGRGGQAVEDKGGEPAVSNVVRDSGRSASATPFEIAPTVVQRYAWGRAKHARAVQQQLRQPAQAEVVPGLVELEVAVPRPMPSLR